MLSPYSLARPGGVQGQVIGLARSLRALGHEVTVLAPARPGDEVPDAVGEHYVIGRPVALRSNGSVAPVALWPTAAARAERFVRKGDFDVVHLHEPLAPMASYGFVLTAPLPMVGTYHRAGVSRWVRPLRPLAELVGRRMQIRVAVSESARETGLSSGGGDFEVLFNGVDMERFESAPPHRDAEGRPAVLFLGRHEPRKGLQRLARRLRHVGPARRPVGGRRRSRHRGAAPAAPPSRIGCTGWACSSDEEVASRLAGADVLCAPSLQGESFGMVLLEGMAAGCTVVASDIEGYRVAAGRPRHAGPARRRPCAGPCPGRCAG